MNTLSAYNQNSLFSFMSIKPKLSEKQKEVYDAMRMYNRPFTDKDIATFLGWPINCITNRRGEIAKKGLIRKAGTVFQSGRPATLWEVGKII